MLRPPVKLLLLSARRLWAEACRYFLESHTRKIEVAVVLIQDGLTVNLATALDNAPAVILVALDQLGDNLAAVRAFRAAGSRAGMVIFCSHHAPPHLDDLREIDVQGIVSPLTSLAELAATIYAVADQCPAPLAQQYRQAFGTRCPTDLRRILTNREREILRLVASDLTDCEIATRLCISERTVSNTLRQVYSKLGVRGRIGAVMAALNGGILQLSPQFPPHLRQIE